MKITFSVHALTRMRERLITRREVYLTVLHPDRLEIDHKSQWRYLAKRVARNASGKSRLLMIIYELREETIEVVTVISTSKIDKYL